MQDFEINTILIYILNSVFECLCVKYHHNIYESVSLTIFMPPFGTGPASQEDSCPSYKLALAFMLGDKQNKNAFDGTFNLVI